VGISAVCTLKQILACFVSRKQTNKHFLQSIIIKKFYSQSEIRTYENAIFLVFVLLVQDDKTFWITCLGKHSTAVLSKSHRRIDQPLRISSFSIRVQPYISINGKSNDGVNSSHTGSANKQLTLDVPNNSWLIKDLTPYRP